MRTWHVEMAVVAVFLAVTSFVSGNQPMEWIGSAAVLLTFGHASVAERMRERQQAESPDVTCHRWLTGYWAGKEVLWILYFAMHHSYAALVGAILFLIYPIWRKTYRRLRPLDRDMAGVA